MKLSTRESFLIILLLLAVLSLAAAFRTYNLGSQSLWSDEGNSAALAGRPAAEILRDAGSDIHPPLYYLLLRGWTRLLGTTEAGLRSLSVLLGVLLVLATAEIGRRLQGEMLGLAAGFIAAFAPFQIYYSQEARMYVLLALLAAVSALCTWWLIATERQGLQPTPSLTLPQRGGEKKRARLSLLNAPTVLLGLTWAAGLYTHYAFPVMIAAAGVVYLAWWWHSRHECQAGRRLLRWVLAGVLALLLFSPWLPIAFRQLTAWPTGGEGASLSEVVATTVSMLGLGPAGRISPYGWVAWPLLALALSGAFPWGALRPRVAYSGAGTPVGLRDREPAGLAGPPLSQNARARRPDLNLKRLAPPWWLEWLLPVVWAMAPIAMMLAFGLFRDAYLKFLLIAGPAYAVLIARGILEPARRLVSSATGEGGALKGAVNWRGTLAVVWVSLTLGGVGAASGAVLSTYYTDPAAARDDYRSIAQFIDATAQPNDAILLDAPGQAEVFRYYYNGSLTVYPLPRQRPLDRAATEKELELLLGHSKVYALYWASQEADPDRLIENWMDNRGYKTVDRWRGNVRMAVYVMPATGAPEETVQNLDASLGSEIQLLGYQAWNLAPTAGEVTQLKLLWRATARPERRYKVFLQLLDAKDQVIAQRDAEPAGESRPTNTWEPGEVIEDNHGLLIRPGTPPGSYRRIIGMYDPETNERLRFPDGKDYLNLPAIRVERSPNPPSMAALDMQYTQSFEFGGISLLGHDRYKRGFAHAPDTALIPGDLLHLTFYWQAHIEPRADWWFTLTLDDGAGHTVATLQSPLVSESYGTTLWQNGEIVRAEHDLLIPADLSPGNYLLSLTLLPDSNTPAGQAYLGSVHVSRP